MGLLKTCAKYVQNKVEKHRNDYDNLHKSLMSNESKKIIRCKMQFFSIIFNNT